MSHITGTNPLGFLSYVHDDDDASGNYITNLCDSLVKETRVVAGQRTFDIFRDRKHIAPGQPWEKRLQEGIAGSALFLPVITPLYFQSTPCRQELEHFLDHERRLGRNDLMLPQYLIDVPELSVDSDDPLVAAVAGHQWTDWRDLRSARDTSSKEFWARHKQAVDGIVRVVKLVAPPIKPVGTASPEAVSPPRSGARQSTIAAVATTPNLEPLPGLRLLPIPAGAFMMGTEGTSGNEQPVHLVQVPAFLLAETPVTNRQYERFLKETKHREPKYWKDGRFSDADQPVVGVSWEDAGTFCRWLSSTAGHIFRLPSEAEWEYAARGTDGRKYPWGDQEPTVEHACFGLDWAKGKPAPVGSFPVGRGPFGTLDQAGNVWEWCADTWHYSYKGAPADGSAWTDGGSEIYVLRGGAWGNRPGCLRAAYRSWSHTVNRLDSIGFRVAVAPAGTPAS